MLYHAGRLEEAEEYLVKSQQSSSKSAYSPGYYFCKGLYGKYMNDISSAIECFNKARQHTEYSPKALGYMIQLYLNPDKENLWEQTSDSHADAENIRIAEYLLNQFPSKVRTLLTDSTHTL
jgi:tetratricopeptide repeat protein 21B